MKRISAAAAFLAGAFACLPAAAQQAQVVTTCGSTSPFPTPAVNTLSLLTVNPAGQLCSTGGGSSGGGAVTAVAGAYADGSIVTLGTEADAAWSGTGSGTDTAILKAIYAAAAIIQTNTASPVPVGGAFSDPCTTATTAQKLNATVYQTSSGTIITGASGKKNYICSFDVVGSAAYNASLVEYSGTCTGGTAYADWGSTTAANGYSFAANGGISKGNGGAVVISGGGNTNTGYNVCLLQNGTANLNASVTYVQQ
jgi:hypothetical protein